MMVYIKDKGRYKTLKEIAQEYNVPLSLVRGRAHTGIKEVEKLIEPKWAKWEKDNA